jgi:hypothetical protein
MSCFRNPLQLLGVLGELFEDPPVGGSSVVSTPSWECQSLTSKAWGTGQPQGSPLARSSWESMLSW